MSKIQHLSKDNQKATMYRLKRIAKDASLSNPRTVESYIYNLDISNNCKNKLFLAYECYCKANDIEYQKPSKLPVKQFPIRVPTEERINLIIANCGWVYSVVFSLSKYGLRPDEQGKLKLKDVDLDRGIITVPTSKLGNQRDLKLDSKTLDLLRHYVSRRKLQSPNSNCMHASASFATIFIKLA